MRQLRTQTIRSAAALVLAAAVAACDGGSREPGAARLEVVDGDDQTGVVGSELGTMIAVRVVSATGEPVRGHVVTFHVVAGGGSAFGGSSQSDAAGLVRERWTLGTTAGLQRLEARAADSSGAPALVVSIRATAVAGAPASVTASAGGGQVAEQLTRLPSPVVAHVADAYGNAVAGTRIDFVAAGGSSVSPPFVTSDPSGDGTAEWTLGAGLGPQVLEARVDGLTPALFTATATAGPLRARLVVASGADQVGVVGGVLPQPVAVLLTDLDGQPLSGRPVTFRVAAGGGSVATPTAQTDAGGLAVDVWTLGTTASAQRIEASAVDPVSGRAVGPISVGATAVAGPPAVVLANDRQPPSPHRSFSISARVADAFGNGIAGEPVTFDPAPGCGTAIPAVATSDPNGVATSTWTHTDVPGVQTLAAGVAGVAPGSFHHTVAAGEVFDGTYVGSYTCTMTRTDPVVVSEPCDPGTVTAVVVDGAIVRISVCSFGQQQAVLPAAGTFTMTGSGTGGSSSCDGTFSVGGPGGATVQGDYWFQSADHRFTASWTATRQ